MALKSGKEANRKTVLVTSLIFVVILGIVASFYYSPSAIDSQQDQDFNQALAGQAFLGVGTVLTGQSCSSGSQLISSRINQYNPSTGNFEVPSSFVPLELCCPSQASCAMKFGGLNCFSEGAGTGVMGNLFCTPSGDWEQCDNTPEIQGLIRTTTGGEKAYCSSGQWQICNPNVNPTTIFDERFHFDASYSLTLQDDGCYNINTYIGAATAGGSSIHPGLYLCDQGTQSVADRATVCLQGSPQNPIESLSVLRNANRNPTTNQQITFLYQQPTQGSQKQVDAILTNSISVGGQGIQFPLGIFSQNLIQGQSLLFVLENQYYELTHASGQTLFSLDQLQLRHIPRLTTYAAQQYAGTNSYVFDVENSRTIIVTINQGQVMVRAGNVGEAPANFVTPFNLEQDHEIQVALNAPVDITTPASNPLGVLTICRQDNSADLQQALLCNDQGAGAQTLATLRRDVLTVLPVTAGGQTTDYAFLYQHDGNEKKVSIFTLTDLANTQSNLNYNDFINAMIAGRRKAVRFQNNVYLLEHPQQTQLSLQSINLVHYTASGQTTIPATGSEDIAHFSTLNGGRITIQRNYGVPPPPFQISALTAQQVVDTPVDLNGQLFVSMSSQTPVRITSPQNEGVVAVAQNDLATFQPTFQLDVGGTPVSLNYQQPLQRGPYLYYYDNIQVNGNTPIKTVSIYRRYDVPNILGYAQRTFDEYFVNNLTSGNEFALAVTTPITNAIVYYAVGYAAQNTQTQIFDMQQIRIYSLDHQQVYQPTLETRNGDLVAMFSLPQGDVEFIIPSSPGPNRVIRFYYLSQDIRDSLNFVAQNSFTLTTTNSVLINNQRFQLCNQQIYQDLTAANVCWGATAAQQLVVDGNEYLTLAGQEYVLESNGLTRENKQVTIRKVTRIDSTNPAYGPTNWTAFTGQVINNDVPVFNISGALYQPVAQDSLLQNFAMQSYPAGQLSSIQNIQSQSPILSSGTLLLGQNIVDITQSLSGPINERTVDATFALRSYNVVPTDGSSIAINHTSTVGAFPASLLDFVTTPAGNQYVLQLTATPTDLINLRITDVSATPRQVILDRLFAQGDTRAITLDGQAIQIIVQKINEDRANNNYYTEVEVRR